MFLGSAVVDGRTGLRLALQITTSTETRKEMQMKQNSTRGLAAVALLLTLLPGSIWAQGGTPVTLDAVAKQALTAALTSPDGEYAARAEYAVILATFGAGIQPYANILEAENKHIAALQQQCMKFGVPIPQDTYWGTVTPPATLLEAAESGVEAENLNIAMYDDLLTKVVKYPSLVQVFTNLRAASLNNHLPAFEAAFENGGTLP